ncbi:stalk domain-containing protein [Paenibacillus sp. N3.4]|uniref:stalk domain-containing protein n=1 Tax=Paenibacillus sp. N3.4 TaxID=2603222 RepID=UPI0011C852AC|nr:stalk domain-containing protein [Paenibacillus sp. N3.4]TXK80387.1 hypothetical protein FU659_18395 [Paenibacillus sp. N3.4]
MNKMVLLSGWMVALVVGIGTIVHADPRLEEVKAYINHDLKLKLNGVQTSIETITYNDTTYVPIRSLSEQLNVQVGWDGSTTTVDLTPNKWIAFDNEQSQSMISNGYTIQAPLWIDSIRYDVLTKQDVERAIQQGNLDQGTMSAVIIQYMIQDENLHKLHEEIARIEVMKKENVHPLDRAKVLAEQDGLVYLVKTISTNPFIPTNVDYESYEALALHLSHQGYYFKLL